MDDRLKKELKAALAREGLTLRAWVEKNAMIFLNQKHQVEKLVASKEADPDGYAPPTNISMEWD